MLNNNHYERIKGRSEDSKDLKFKLLPYLTSVTKQLDRSPIVSKRCKCIAIFDSCLSIIKANYAKTKFQNRYFGDGHPKRY